MRAHLALILALAIVIAPAMAFALEQNFSGSVQLHAHAEPTARDPAAKPAGPSHFDVEAAARMQIDLSTRLHATVKLCFGCHGIEPEQAYASFRLVDELGIQLGYFSPTFGGLGARSSAAYRVASDAPLPYDMGRMLRATAWNVGVLPAPFAQPAVELSGMRWVRPDLRLDYAAHLSTGFVARADGSDIDWVASRGVPYYRDDNGSAQGGGRVRATLRIAPDLDLAIGASVMHGAIGKLAEGSCTIAGGDVTLQTARTALRAEYLVRVQSAGPAFADTLRKHGAYVELEHQVHERVLLFVRADLLAREGPVGPTDPLGHAQVMRYAAGGAVVVERGFRLKASSAMWLRSGPEPAADRIDVSFHLSGVVLF